MKKTYVPYLRAGTLYRVLMRILTVIVILSLALPGPNVAQAQDESLGLLTVTPESVRPSGVAVVYGYQLSPWMNYTIGLMGRSGFFPGSETKVADARGNLQVRVTVPAEMQAGKYAMVIATRDGTIVRSKEVQILSPLALTLDPTAGEPGTMVKVSLDQLDAGELTIYFADKAVVGPMKVTGPGLTESFSVPWGVATTGDVEVRADNVVGDKLAGSARVTFTQKPAVWPALPEFSDLEISPNPLMPGQKYTITGKIWPVPEELLQSRSQTLASPASYAGTLGVTFKDLDTPDYINASGSMKLLDVSTGHFSYEGHAPDMRFGDSMSVRKDMTVELTYNGQTIRTKGELPVFGPDYLKVVVVTTDVAGNPIGGPKVSIRDITPPPPDRDRTMVRHNDKLNKYFFDQAMREILCGYADHKGAKTVPETGLVEFITRVDDLVINPTREILMSQFAQAPIVVSEDRFLKTTKSVDPSLAVCPPRDENYYDWRMFSIYADGRKEGFSYYQAGSPPWTPEQSIKVYEGKVWLNITNGKLYDKNCAPYQDSDGSYRLELPFEPISHSEIASFLQIEQPQPISGHYTDPNSGLPTYTGFFDLSSVPTWSLTNLPEAFTIPYTWSHPSETLSDKIMVLVDNDLYWDSRNDPLSGGGEGGTNRCGNAGQSSLLESSMVSNGVTGYQIRIPFPRALSPGLRQMTIIFDLGGIPIAKGFNIKVEAPPTWFLSPTLGERKVGYNSDGSFLFSGQALNQYQHNWGSGANQLSPQVPTIGKVTNDARANTTLNQVYKSVPPVGGGGIITVGGLKSDAMAAGTKALANKPDNPKLGTDIPAGVNAASMTIYVDKYDIPLAYVALPVFVAAFSDPFGGAIVSGSAGMLVEAFASADFHGVISTSNVDLMITPKATINSQIWLDINVLYGVLAQAALTFYPKFKLSMEVNFKYSSSGPSISAGNACIGYRGDMYFYFGFICPPLFGCLIEHKGLVNVYNGTYPDNRPNCTINISSIRSLFPHLQPYGPELPEPPVEELLQLAYATRPVMLDTYLTNDVAGTAVLLMQADGKTLSTQKFENGIWLDQSEIKTGIGNNDPRMATLTAKTALVLWTGTGYSSEAELQQHSMEEVAKSQYIEWTLLTDGLQGLNQPLTAPFSGDGQVAVASCLGQSNGCPTTGQVTAAWMHMKSDDPYLGGYRVQYATYKNGAWGDIATVPAPEEASDTQAKVVYRGNQAYIYFVRDLDGTGKTTNDRRIYQYSLGDGSAVQLPDLPDSVVDFSVALDEFDDPHITFTRVDQPEVGLLDNRHPLYSAKSYCNLDSCDWTVHKLKDTYGREIYAEGGVLVMKPGGEGVLTYRALGMGPDGDGRHDPKPGDTTGLIQQSGELAKLVITFDNVARMPQYLTNDGAIYWNPQSVFDRSSDVVVSSAVRTAMYASPARPSLNGVVKPPTATSMLPNSAVVFAVQADRPNFVLAGLSAEETVFETEGALPVKVRVLNDGASWQGSEAAPLKVIATWDAPYGEGRLAGLATLTALGAGETLDLDLDVGSPVTADLLHKLHVMVVAPPDAMETSLLDNDAVMEMAGMPAPRNLLVLAHPGSRTILTMWDASPDPRIEGYRIYRAEGKGNFDLVGSTEDMLWVDDTAKAGVAYRYVVAGYSGTGSETPWSQPALSNPIFQPVYLPVLRR